MQSPSPQSSAEQEQTPSEAGTPNRLAQLDKLYEFERHGFDSPEEYEAAKALAAQKVAEYGAEKKDPRAALLAELQSKDWSLMSDEAKAVVIEKAARLGLRIKFKRAQSVAVIEESKRKAEDKRSRKLQKRLRDHGVSDAV